MSLSPENKRAVVAGVVGALSNAQAAILAEYRGLTVADMTRLRAEAREAGVFLKVVKNTLARRAVKGSSFECLDEHLVGPLALAASQDPVAVAKILHTFAKDHEALNIKAGAMSGNLLTHEQIQALAKLPGRDELLAKLAGTLQAPLQKLVQTLNAVPGTFVRTVAAVRDAKSEAQA
ncbi:MAG: 50S ribosomal protein L10 [Gammaproteobacteria bacterium]|nr:50S ribosomal protein L10 [Gammaproteobacteria bacterium]